MTKQVLITISGLQLMDGETGRPVEVVTAGEYYQKNGKHYLFYEEAVEGSREHIENRLKIGEGSLEVTKKGLIRTHMVFEKGRKTKTSYETPLEALRWNSLLQRFCCRSRKNSWISRSAILWRWTMCFWRTAPSG